MRKQDAGGILVWTHAEPLMLIPLSMGGKHGDGRMKYALIDAADYDLVKDRKWHANWNPQVGGFYAGTSALVQEGRGERYLHRMILGLAPGDPREADHGNHVTLDNRRSNIRVATPCQNAANKGLRRNSRSGFKGVSSAESCWRGRWVARIRQDGKVRHLGYYKTPEEAAAAYDAAARAMLGEFARTNAG